MCKLDIDDKGFGNQLIIFQINSTVFLRDSAISGSFLSQRRFLSVSKDGSIPSRQRLNATSPQNGKFPTMRYKIFF